MYMKDMRVGRSVGREREGGRQKGQWLPIAGVGEHPVDGLGEGTRGVDEGRRPHVDLLLLLRTPWVGE